MKELIGSHWSAWDFNLGFQVIYRLVRVDDNGDPVMFCSETNTEKSISPRALGTNYHRKWSCPKCRRWLQYEHLEETCFHASISELNRG